MPQRFAVTLTFRPPVFRYKAEDQHDRHHVDVCDVLRGLGRFSLVAELTKSSNVHFHALLECDGSEVAVRKRVNDAVRRHPVIGFCCTKLCTDEPGWADYMSKEVSDYHEVMKRHPIIADGLDIFSRVDKKFTKHLQALKRFE